MLPFRDYNPSRTFPLVTVSLIAINVLIFLYMATLRLEGESVLTAFVNRYAVVPAAVTGNQASGEIPAWLTLITAMFLHGGPLHLLGNMLYLWIFGNNVEDIMGHGRYLIFYLITGILATLAFVFLDPNSTIPLLGASGAIAGVLGAYLVRFPFAQVDTCLFVLFFVTVIRLPAIVILAFWFIIQVMSGTASLLETSNDGGGVAWWAHIGGFLAGMVLVNLFAVRRQPRTFW